MKSNTKSSKKKVLVIGSHGMLGQELVRVFKDDLDYKVTGWDMKDIDITKAREVSSKIGKLKPDIILNAAAYNTVDAAEKKSEFEKAKKLNGIAPGHLAKIAKKINAILVHYSTDYVFDGMPDIDMEPAGCKGSCGSCSLHDNFEPEIGFRENDKPKPINKYGTSKLLGESEVKKVRGKYYIIRLSKLFGKPAKAKKGKKSFFDIMLEASKNPPKEGIRVVDEETSCFTYAPDLSRKTKEIIEAKKPYGTYHITNSNPCTWYEAVRELYKQKRIKAKIIPVPGSEFPRPAERPFISTLINTKTNPLRGWKEALKEYLKTRKNT